MIAMAFAGSPAASAAMNRGMSIRTGHPCTHGAFLHWRQRAASTRTCSSK